MQLGCLGAQETGQATTVVRRLLRAGESARMKVTRNWSLIGGVAAAVAASVYVLWGPIAERKKCRKGLVPGLLNLGNTCFMNSLLQGLSACPSFLKWLEGFTHRDPAGQSGRGRRSLSLTLLHLLKALSCQEATEDDLLDASGLLEVLRLYRWQISSFEEQDAHELFHVLTSSLEEEQEGQPHIPHLFDVHSLEQPEIPQDQICCRTRGPLHPVPNLWKRQHPFHGRLTSNMICKRCKHQSPLRYDTFDSLSLSIPSTLGSQPLTLDHCLHHFISSESVQDVVCDNCAKIQAGRAEIGPVMENWRTTFVKQLKLGKMPQCLCIHLQRLSWSSHGLPLKRNEHVQFGEFLIMDLFKHRFPAHRASRRETLLAEGDTAEGQGRSCSHTLAAGSQRCGGSASSFLPDTEQAGDSTSILTNGSCSTLSLPPPVGFPYMALPVHSCQVKSRPSYVYRLMAVVVHHGDMHTGHFVTYRRSPPSPKTPLPASNQWLWISDDSVRKTTLREVLSSSAYLLFYERIRSRLQHQSQELQAEE